MSYLCKRLRRATVLRELIRGWRIGENVEFEDRMQIEDDVVDVFNIPVVGDSAVVDVPGGESAVVDVPDGDSAVVDVSDGESAVVDVPNERRAIVDVSDVENAGVDVSGGESSVC
ncbi:sperm acrosomal protein fsa-acr.1 [Plakobranchus ocellatus]|uniref:Sperm acrosomal protein fsa-acr.1 n=1 Tax=Plakobranchus ocellatus TaxID=259542 RepID=A0AAV3Z933_9GAST|nr:sperm acrosomal protein fsa-acr.1 [Plakobranchus ocellatus]